MKLADQQAVNNTNLLTSKQQKVQIVNLADQQATATVHMIKLADQQATLHAVDSPF